MVLAAILLGLPSSAPPAQEPRAADGSEPVLVIDGRPIGGDEFGRWLLRTQGEKSSREFGHRHLVIDREARRLGVDVPAEEVDREVERAFAVRIAGAFLGSRAAWIEELARTGRSEGGLRRQREIETRAELQARNVAALDRVVAPFLIEREWELRHGRRGRRYDLRMIRSRVVTPSRPGDDREQWKAGRQRAMDEALARARSIRERALAGEDFGLLATQFSDDPDTRDHRGAPSGGFRDEGWPRAFLDGLAKLQPGEILDPAYARGGYWIAKVLAVHVTPLEEVRAGIEADLLARGPEPYEIGMTQQRLAEGVLVRPLPGMLAEPPPGEISGVSEPALLVDGEPVPRAQYARWLLHTRGEILAPDFVNEWVVERRAREAGVSAPPAEIDARVRERLQDILDRSHRGDRGVWRAYLELSGRSEEWYLRELADRVRVDLLAEKLLLLGRRISPEEVRASWIEQYGGDGDRVDVSQILVRVGLPDLGRNLSQEEVAEVLRRVREAAGARAGEIFARLSAGEDFAEVARRESDDDRTKASGGALPGRFRPDAWPAEIAAAVAGLQPGQWTKPLLGEHGWVILKVTARRRVAFEDVKEELERELLARRPSLGEVIIFRNDLARGAKIEVLPGMWR